MDDPAAAERERFEMPLGTTPIPSTSEDFGIDAELIKVLASDSRRDILRLLHQRRMTLTELAAALDLKKATVLEHLKRLTDTGLVRRLDEDRLWVYYELSGRGKRVVNPGRTRFYLMMGVTAAALVLAGAVFAAVLMNAPSDTGSPLAPPMGATDGWAGAPSVGGLSVEVGDVAPGSRAYLLSASEVESLKADKGVVGGIPLAYAESNGSVARFQAYSAVPAGTYFVYVVEPDGRDNLADITSVRIPSLDVQGPTLAWKGVDEGASFRVSLDGNPATGSLLLASGEGRELPVLQIEDGVARLDQATLDRLVPAVYSIQYLPQGQRYWLTVGSLFEVREALATPIPAVVAEGRPAEVELFAAPQSWSAPERFALFVEGAATDAEKDDGRYVVALDALAPGDVRLQLGRATNRTIEVRPDVQLTFYSATSGLSAAVSLPDGSTLGGALLQVDGKDYGTTDADGRLDLALPDGTHRLTVVANTQPLRFVSRAVVVEGWNVSAADAGARIVDVDATSADGRVEATVLLENRGVAPETGTLLLHADGDPVAWAVVDVPPLGNATRTLATSHRLPPGDHAVSVSFLPLERAPIRFVNLSAPPAGSTNASGSPSAPAYDQLDHDDRSPEPQEVGAGTVRVAGAATNASKYTVVVTTDVAPRGTATSTTPTPEAAGADARRVAGPALPLALAAVAIALLLRHASRR